MLIPLLTPLSHTAGFVSHFAEIAKINARALSRRGSGGDREGLRGASESPILLAAKLATSPAKPACHSFHLLAYHALRVLQDISQQLQKSTLTSHVSFAARASPFTF